MADLNIQKIAEKEFLVPTVESHDMIQTGTEIIDKISKVLSS